MGKIYGNDSACYACERKVGMMKEQLYFPIFVNLSEKKVIVVGGGAIAARRVRTLLLFGCEIIVIAPNLNDSMKLLFGENPKLIWKPRVYRQGDCDGAFLVVAATNCRQVNQEIGQECQRKGIFVSVADRKEESSFYFPAIAMNGPIVAGITSSGTNHKQAAQAAEEVRNCFAHMRQQEEKKVEKEIERCELE
ncbi:Precorrin-2 dehydrogenase [Clostridiales bacterium CHKCI001]|nr:Precorrin-2 dehydrogenase [Clostridiales bacterium CHKCI001]